MNLTRRNTVIGIGTLAAGAGVIGGSGAFDSVEANRSFEINVSGDAGALLGLAATNSIIAGTTPGGAGGNDIIYFELNDAEAGGDAAVNESSLTEFFDVFSVTNNGTQDIDLSIELPTAISGVAFTLASERAAAAPTDLASQNYTLAAGSSISVDLQVDTTTAGGYVQPTGGTPYQITIRAISV